MNILYYCDEYPPARNGGIGTVVKLVAEAMSQRGHNVIVAGRYWNGAGRETIERINGVTVIRWHKGSYDSIIMWFLTLFHSDKNKRRKAQLIFSKTQGLLEKVTRKYSIEIVETPDYVDDFMHQNGLSTPKWRSNVPKVIRVHGSVSFLYHYLRGRPDANKVRQDRDFFNQSDAICAVSSFSKEYVTRFLCEGQSVDVIYNPIEEHWFKQFAEEKESQTILYFGKIARMKGVFSLIKAFNLIAADYPSIKLKLIGNGNPKHVKELVEPCFTDRVVFAGFMPQEQIMKEIDNALFCILPSYFENFSMAALEVLARNKTLIYTNRASGQELIKDGENGLLVNPDDVEQIARNMRLLLSDKEFRSRMAERGNEMCRRRFSTETIIPQMESYYEEVIERCKG